MTGPDDDAVPPGLADHPLEVRRAQEVERRRELDEGLTRRHLANAEYRGSYLAVQFDRVLRMGKREG